MPVGASRLAGRSPVDRIPTPSDQREPDYYGQRASALPGRAQVPPGITLCCASWGSIASAPTSPRPIRRSRFRIHPAGDGRRSDGGLHLRPSEPLDRQVAPALIRQFHEQTGASSLLLQPGQEPTVRITFIDSEPTAISGPPRRVRARNTATPSCTSPDSSSALLRSPGSLRGQALEPPGLELSLHGSAPALAERSWRLRRHDLRACRGDLAEVLDWQPTENLKHLILNLSLGWDGEGLGDLKAREPSVRLVQGALRLAAQKGVLVIAAAGNRRGGSPGSRLPILPAAWELRRPSSLAVRLVPQAGLRGGRSGLAGVAAVQCPPRRLPRRVAYGDHAVAEVGGRPTRIYTGSSVSTAVVSAVAAVVWHLRPDLTPDQVMKLIDHSGRVLPARADFYPWRHILPPPRIQRVSLCAAVTRACGPGVGPCPGLAERSKMSVLGTRAACPRTALPNDRSR